MSIAILEISRRFFKSVMQIFQNLLTFLCGYIIISLCPQRKEVMCLGIKKGTKLTDTPKDKMLRIRVDAETERKLECVCELTEKSKSEVIRDGIDKQYAEIRSGKDD